MHKILAYPINYICMSMTAELSLCTHKYNYTKQGSSSIHAFIRNTICKCICTLYM